MAALRFGLQLATQHTQIKVKNIEFNSDSAAQPCRSPEIILYLVLKVPLDVKLLLLHSRGHETAEQIHVLLSPILQHVWSTYLDIGDTIAQSYMLKCLVLI